MKALLNAVRTRLESQLSYIRKVGVVADTDLALVGVPHPYVTLADRGLVRDYDSSSRIETLTIRVTSYQEVLQDEGRGEAVSTSGKRSNSSEMVQVGRSLPS